MGFLTAPDGVPSGSVRSPPRSKAKIGSSFLVIDHDELAHRGWTTVSRINSCDELLNLAKSLGTPLQAPTGELIKRLTVKPAAEARAGTLSATFGAKSFPLHTDTAFWSIPARYLVMRVHGDYRRSTTVLSFKRMFRDLRFDISDDVRRSVWVVRTPLASRYRMMQFQV